MQKRRTERGFTLLEVIVTITVAAILASFLVAFMGTAITRSSDPVKQVRDLAASNGSIESMTAAYYTTYLKGSRTQADWDTFKTLCGSYSTIASGGIYSPSFETIQVTRMIGNQRFVSYFMQ